MSANGAILSISNIEVIYDHVILVLKGVSLEVPEGKIVALLGANGAGKTTTLKAISNLLRAERGDVTKGTIVFRGERIDQLEPPRAGEARRLPGDGGPALLPAPHGRGEPAHRRLSRAATSRAELAARTWRRSTTTSRGSRSGATQQSGYTSGGEQQMTAIGRALMARPQMILLDEPSMGLAPQLVEEIFEIVQELNRKERVSASCSPSRTPTSRCATPTTATSSRTAAW